MRTLTTFLFACAVLIFATAGNSNLMAGEGHDHGDPMAAWTEFAKVTEVHQNMMNMVGNWTTSTKSWMGPGEPTVSSGSATYRALLDGRYIEGTHIINFDMGTHEGVSVMAYDTALEKFVSTWIDNMGTGVSVMEGHFDPKTQTFYMQGTTTDPVSKGPMKLRSESKVVSKDKSIFTMWGEMPGPDGKMVEVKMMEITYTRA